jgi:hypothetical protein
MEVKDPKTLMELTLSNEDEARVNYFREQGMLEELDF